MSTTDTAISNRRTFVREMRVKLTEAEITDRGRRLAARRQDRAALNERRQAVAKDYGGQLAQIDAELDGLQVAINTGSELRPVACYEVANGWTIEIRRADNDEVIDQRALTAAEQNQRTFDQFDDEKGEGEETEGDVDDPEDDFGGAVAPDDPEGEDPVEETPVKPAKAPKAPKAPKGKRK